MCWQAPSRSPVEPLLARRRRQPRRSHSSARSSATTWSSSATSRMRFGDGRSRRDPVRVEIGENTATATAGADGKWQARIQPPPAGGPYTVKIAGRQQTVELHDVLVGDVWICAGQSNMQFGLRQARNGAEEIKNANYPDIRYYVVGERVSYSPVDVPRGSWKVVSPTTARWNLGGGLFLCPESARIGERAHRPDSGSGGRRSGGNFHQLRRLAPAEGLRCAHRVSRRPAAEGRQGVRQLHHALV